MADETTILNDDGEQTKTPEEILVAMKENMVPKEEAQQWQKKYNDLFAKVANGTFSGSDADQHIESADERRARVTNEITHLRQAKCGSIDHMKALVDFDDERRAEGQRSIFVNSRGDVSADTQEFADNFNALLKEAIAAADGDSNVASTYLVSRMTGFSLATK